MKTKHIIVGGFLGAGKTSLLWEAALKIDQKGNKVGLITNDQAAELVDTAFLERNSNLVREVSGSCFCCNFNGFADAIKYISEKNGGGVIFAEPVGSCTDLSATIMQPLKEKHPEIDLAPLTVLADPFRLKAILQSAATPAEYIVLKQFEEADLILINKTDLMSGREIKELVDTVQSRWKNTKVMTASVKTGEGIDQWLDAVMSESGAGAKITEVDYDIYAEGEAAFGWLNVTYRINTNADFDNLSEDFINYLSDSFDKKGINVGHVKFLLQTFENQIVGNITGKKNTAQIRKYNNTANKITLTVNARAETDPDTLENIVNDGVKEYFDSLGCEKYASKCLIPGRPNPTYRYEKVIGS
ncbi:MAG: hypothetical protein FWE57_01450 [Chitinispirillia bacterium]|nr:hypothetical protein [Chitinispirillia bacterium]